MHEHTLRQLIDAIISNNNKLFTTLLGESPALATAAFTEGATHQDPGPHFLPEIRRYIYTGDTALHFAAACYRRAMAEALIRAGASVHAKNRRGATPLHAASVGGPGSAMWEPVAQAETIAWLISAGADPNAANMDGATPLHLAVRSRCAEAVRTLLAHGADPTLRNKSGSAALQLATHTTGRSGSGSPEAKAQQQEILQLLSA